MLLRQQPLYEGYGETGGPLLTNIPLGNVGTVGVEGHGAPPNSTVYVAGEPVPVDAEGDFVAETILPPGLHTVEVAALDAFDAILQRDDLRLDMMLEPGDLQFANNYVTLHTRSAYEDHEDPAKKRLLWRLWLMNPDLRERTAYAMQWQGGVKPGAGHTQIRI